MVDKSVAVVGCGYWEKNIVRALYELKALYAVCDLDANVACKIVAEYKGTISLCNFEDVIADKNIDAVVISTPAVTHFELAKRCLNAGKDVFVEKPLALDLVEGQELVDLAANLSRILMVGHVLNYHSAVRELKKLVANGFLGRLQYIYSNRLSFGKIRREENILWSFAPHDISRKKTKIL